MGYTQCQTTDRVAWAVSPAERRIISEGDEFCLSVVYSLAGVGAELIKSYSTNWKSRWWILRLDLRTISYLLFLDFFLMLGTVKTWCDKTANKASYLFSYCNLNFNVSPKFLYHDATCKEMGFFSVQRCFLGFFFSKTLEESSCLVCASLQLICDYEDYIASALWPRAHITRRNIKTRQGYPHTHTSICSLPSISLQCNRPYLTRAEGGQLGGQMFHDNGLCESVSVCVHVRGQVWVRR